MTGFTVIHFVYFALRSFTENCLSMIVLFHHNYYKGTVSSGSPLPVHAMHLFLCESISSSGDRSATSSKRCGPFYSRTFCRCVFGLRILYCSTHKSMNLFLPYHFFGVL